MAANNEVLAEVERLINTQDGLLTVIDKQRKYISRIHLMKSPCPYCEKDCSFFAAVEAHYKLGGGETPKAKTICPNCKQEISEIVPLISAGRPWFWGPVKPILEAAKEIIEQERANLIKKGSKP